MLSNLCECGCGEFTKLASKTDTKRGWIKGKPLRFVNGHNNAHEGKPNSKVNKICVICGKDYNVWPTRIESTTCSIKCSRAIIADKLTAPEGNIRKSSGGYLQIKVSDHPYADSKGYVMYHRWVVEQHHKKFIEPEYDVHHIDGNVTNNNLNNLVVMTRSSHMSLHARKRKFWELSPR